VTPNENPIEVHRQNLTAFSRPGGILDAINPAARTSKNNPQWWVDGIGWSPERAKLHIRLLDAHSSRFENVGRAHRAIVLAGPPGAGKTSVINRVLADAAAEWMVVDADYFKERLMAEAVADGTYDSYFKDHEIKELEAKGEKFFPLEFASLVHEESSYLAAHARDEALLRGDNLVIDGVLSSPQKAVWLGKHLASHGYEIFLVDVEASREITSQRIDARWRHNYESALRGGSILGGRWVPSEIPRSIFGPSGRAYSEDSVTRLGRACAAVTRCDIYRVLTADGAPALAKQLARVAPEARLANHFGTPLPPLPTGWASNAE
jgi:chloramphenicol 3-O-phosphotransferase